MTLKKIQGEPTRSVIRNLYCISPAHTINNCSIQAKKKRRAREKNQCDFISRTNKQVEYKLDIDFKPILDAKQLLPQESSNRIGPNNFEL
jgi:hypothetical protein